MSFVRLKALARTLRFRLVAWNTLVVLLIVLPTLVVVREGVGRLVHHEIGTILAEDISEIKLAIKQYPTDMPRLYKNLVRKVQGHARHGWFVQLFGSQGRKLWESDSTPEDLPPDLPADQPFRMDIDTYRLVQERLDEPGVSAKFVRVGSSLKLVEEDLGLLTRTLIVVGVLITLLAPLGGYWLSGRAIKPLAKIIHQTSTMKPDNIDERLPLRGSGDELDQLSSTINGLLDRIAADLSQKRDFLANAAHELRSPLAAIRGLVEVALTSERSTPEYVNLLQEIMEECAGLSTLVNQLLLLAEGGAGRLALNPQKVPLDRVVRKSLDMFEGVADAQGIHLQAPDLASVQVAGDENHLRQLINNLLDNAIKFTPPGGSVTVDLSRRNGQAVLRVADTGGGIPPEELPRIFERFYRGDKSRQHANGRRGTGLGLAICKAIVAGHNGSIDVASAPGKGCTFTVDLPAAE
jgi:heavy metal sensor kinase